jgi:hypothetical protein
MNCSSIIPLGVREYHVEEAVTKKTRGVDLSTVAGPMLLVRD